MKKSKLAITSFILSLIPLIFFLAVFLIRVLFIGDIYANIFWLTDVLVFFSFFIFIINGLSLILGGIALIYIKKYGLEGKKLAIRAIIISVLVLSLTIIELISLMIRDIPFA